MWDPETHHIEMSQRRFQEKNDWWAIDKSWFSDSVNERNLPSVQWPCAGNNCAMAQAGSGSPGVKVGIVDILIL